MKVLFACGGTAGHINPALAIADALKKENKKIKILFAGNPNGMESRLAPQAGYRFAPIEIEGFQRKLSVENVKRNAHAAVCLLGATGKAKEIIKEFNPDIVVGTGGYVSGPVLRCAAKMKIKTLTHEQNAFPGVTTKLLCRYVDKVLLAVPKAKDYLPKNREYIVTGNPIRREFLTADRDAARNRLGVGDRVCVLSYGGSLGASRINDAVASVIARFHNAGSLHHIHATGKYGVDSFPARLRELGIEIKSDAHLDIREYIDDMPDCFAAADLIICRAGAISISELEAAGKASVLIPSPNVAENHQYHNAMVLAGRNAAIVIEEKDLTGERLCGVVGELADDRQELVNLGKNAALMAIMDADKRICREIYSLLRKKS